MATGTAFAQDVYVSGNHFTTGKVYKNNTLLYSITDSIDIQLKGIKVAQDGTVYGAGAAYNSSEIRGKVWMNDSCIFTADTNTYFDHFALNGNNWTAAGGNNVWQNGELLYSYSHGEDECHIHDLAVDTTTGDIYAGGAVNHSGEYLTYACVWKNDTLLWMADTISNIYSLCFDGENLYAAGHKFENDSLSYAVIWQNDSIIYQMENADFGCITAFDGSLYWGGVSMTDTIVRIWQDGEVLYTLPELSGISNLVVNESGVYYTDARTVYKDGEVLYQPDEWCILTDLVVKPAPTPPEYTITVESAQPDWGVVSGGGIFIENDTAILFASPKNGCEFLGWNDGNTESPRFVVVTQDSTFTASFARIPYTITVESDNPEWGSVSGGGTYYYGDTIQITAIPNTGYTFVRWNDHNTSNPRTVIVTGNHNYTAYFQLQQCVIHTEVNPEGAGTIHGGGAHYYGETVQLTAIAGTHYTFDRWEDGVTDNPREVLVVCDTTFTALFNPIQYEVTVGWTPEEGGTVTGAGSYDYNTWAVLTAIPNENYTFICWSDGIVRNPRDILVTHDIHINALFHLSGTPEYTVTVTANDSLLGTVTGGGTYPEGVTIDIEAIPNTGAVFMKWDDGNTDNPRSIEVTHDMEFMAMFAEVETYTITVRPENPLMGTTYGSGEYTLNQVVTIGATPSPNFYFSGWQDGDMNNPRTIIVTGDAEYIASFSQNPVETYTVTVLYDESQGFILGAGTYSPGAIASIAAIPADGYEFKKWNDGTTDNPKEVVVDHDITLAAFFVSTGVDENGFEIINLYPNPANDVIHLEGLEGEHEIQMYNAFGMLVMTTTLQGDAEINISDLPAGYYLIRIDNRRAVKFIKENK